MKNKKAQLEIDEINPIGVIGGLLGGILSIIVMSKVEVGIIFKIGAFIGTAIACYFISGKILGD